MEFMQAFQEIMTNTREIALATSVDHSPNVRIVDYYWCNQCNVVYFCTMKQTAKVAELEKNSKVSFITVPVNTMAFVRVSDAVAKISSKSMEDMKDTFVGKYPQFEGMFAMGLDKFELYEITFTTANVSRNFGDFGQITL